MLLYVYIYDIRHAHAACFFQANAEYEARHVPGPNLKARPAPVRVVVVLSSLQTSDSDFDNIIVFVNCV